MIINNRTNYGGGGVQGFHASPQIKGNIISGNHAETYGGGVFLYFEGYGLVERNIITGNTCNYGGGVCIQTSRGVRLINNTIANNIANDWAGGIYSATFSYPLLINNIVWGNTASLHTSLFCASDDSLNISYSDIEGGWEGEGNIDMNPLFADTANGDFSLTWVNFPVQDSTKSPCIDTGHPEPALLDPDSTRCDMGAVYFHQNLVPIAGLTIALINDDVVLTWESIPGAVEYGIFESDSPYFEPSGNPLMVVTAPDTTATIYNVTGEMKYYRVISRR